MILLVDQFIQIISFQRDIDVSKTDCQNNSRKRIKIKNQVLIYGRYRFPGPMKFTDQDTCETADCRNTEINYDFFIVSFPMVYYNRYGKQQREIIQILAGSKTFFGSKNDQGKTYKKNKWQPGIVDDIFVVQKDKNADAYAINNQHYGGLG